MEVQHAYSQGTDTGFIRHNLLLKVINPLAKENALLFIWTLAIHSVTRKAGENGFGTNALSRLNNWLKGRQSRLFKNT